MRETGFIKPHSSSLIKPGSTGSSLAFHVVPRSSWFVSIWGVIQIAFAVIDSIIEGANASLFAEVVIGVLLVCYRVWPSSARARLLMLLCFWMVSVVFLGLRSLCFFLPNISWGEWVGGDSIPGLISTSLAVLILFLLWTDSLPHVLERAGFFHYVRETPLSIRAAVFTLLISTCCVFNPSLLLLPYLVMLLGFLWELANNKPLKDTIFGHKYISLVLLCYTCIYVVIAYALCLVGTLGDRYPNLPHLLGVPSGHDEAHNWQCILPAGICLFTLVIILPWWCDMGTVVHSTKNRKHNDHWANASVASVSPMHHHERQTSSAQQSEDNNVIVSSTKYLVSLSIINFAWPITVIIMALSLSSVLSAILLVGGFVLFSLPAHRDNLFTLSHLFILVYGLFVFIASCFWIWISAHNTADSVLSGFGLTVFRGTLWNRLLLMTVILGLGISSAVVCRFSRKTSKNEESYQTLHKNLLNNIFCQSVVAVMLSVESVTTTVLTVLIITTAAQNQASAMFAIYLLALFPMFMFRTGGKRKILSVTLTVISVFTIVWQMMADAWGATVTADSKLRNSLVIAMPNLLIGLLGGGLYLKWNEIDTEQAMVYYSNIFKSHPVLFSRLAVWTSMILSLSLFVAAPFDYFSALVILCFAAQMAFMLEGHKVYEYILRINAAQLVILVATTLWVLVSMVPYVNEAVIEKLEDSKYLRASELAVMPDCEYIGKLVLVASMLIVSSILLHYRKFIEGIDLQEEVADSATLQNGMSFHGGISEGNISSTVPAWMTNAYIRKLLLNTADQLPRVLLFIIFMASIYQTSLLNIASEFTVCFFLVIGRGWRRVAVLFSVSSMLLLFLQYFSGFHIVTNSVASVTLEYVGMVWSLKSVARNLSIFIACIVERNFRHFVKHVLERGSCNPVSRCTSFVDSVTPMQTTQSIVMDGSSNPTIVSSNIFSSRLQKYAVSLIAILLFLAAAGRANVYSLVYGLVGVVLIVRLTFTNSLLSLWSLRGMALMLWTCITVQLMCRIWLPPTCDSCWSRPDVSYMCEGTEVAFVLGGESIQTTPSLYASCMDDWQRWLNVPTNFHGSTALVDNPKSAQEIAASLQYWGDFEVEPIRGYGLLWDFLVLWFVCICMQNSVIGSELQSLSSTDQEAMLTRTKRRQLAESSLEFLTRYWIIVVEILTVLSCASFGKSVDVFALCFFAVAVWIAWSQEYALPVRRKAIVGALAVSLLLIILFLVYQAPIFSCRYWSFQCLADAPVNALTEPYNVPSVMCVDMQKIVGGCENFGSFRWMQIGIQLLGLLKADVGLFSSPFPMTIGPAILLLCACILQLAIYDYSVSYGRVDAKYFASEFVLRTARGRRFIAEFNARLLIENRRSENMLSATKRKLHRVQESAAIAFSRLVHAAEGNTPNNSPDHLSTLKETLTCKGFSEREADLVLAIPGIDEAAATELLEQSLRFGKGQVQESDVLTGNSGSSSEGITFLDRVSEYLSRFIDDVVFLREPSHASEPLSLHRRTNGLVQLIAKLIYSQSVMLVCFFIVVAFVATNSVFDLVRVGVALFVLMFRWPVAPVRAWTWVAAYSVLGLMLKILYQLPVFCGVGISGGYSPLTDPFWRIRNSDIDGFVAPCPSAVVVGWDVILGIYKSFGSSAIPSLSSTELLKVIWQDLLVVAALLMYRSLLYRKGVMTFVAVGKIERDAGAVLVPKRVELTSVEEDAEGSDDIADSEETALEERVLESGLEEGVTDQGSEPSDVASVIGSFVDMDGNALTGLSSEEISKFAVQRYMGCEDVLDRWAFGEMVDDRSVDFNSCKSGTGDLSHVEASMGQAAPFSITSALTRLYKQLRWDAQTQYGNHQCARIARADREVTNANVGRVMQSLPWASRIFVWLNPYFSVKIGRDYYTWLTLLGMMMFFHVVFFYSSMVGGSVSIVSSLQRSRFSGGLALLMAFHILLIVADRAYYIGSFRRENQNTGLSGLHGTRQKGILGVPARLQVTWFFIRLILVITLAFVIHSLMMKHLFRSHTKVTDTNALPGLSYMPMRKNAALSIYYFEFMCYLLVSVIQLREGFPRVMKESLRPEKTHDKFVDKLQEWRFIVFRAIPFLDEIRMLVDWTITQTSLDLFQYFKLEDAHTYLWLTKREMESRKGKWPAQHRSKWEKAFLGYGFLAVLMLVIIGPVLLFSSLVGSTTMAPITSARMSLSIQVVTCRNNCSAYIGQATPLVTSELTLYTASPIDMKTLDSKESIAFTTESGNIVQQVEFAIHSDSPIVVSADRVRQILDSIPNAVMISIETELEFQRSVPLEGGYVGPESNIVMPSCACLPKFSILCKPCDIKTTDPNGFQMMREAVSTIMQFHDDEHNAATAETTIIFPDMLYPIVHVDSYGSATTLNSDVNPVDLLFSVDYATDTGLAAGWHDTCGVPTTFPGGICRTATKDDLLNNGSQTLFTFILMPVFWASGAGGALFSLGIITIYITIVFAIGRFIRVAFDKDSHKAIYLEIPRPDDFLDLAMGATLARQYKDLPMEFKLYNCLIKILRSPETLMALGGEELNGYGQGRNDDPPYPDLLSDNDKESLLRRRRKYHKS